MISRITVLMFWKIGWFDNEKEGTKLFKDLTFLGNILLRFWSTENYIESVFMFQNILK